MRLRWGLDTISDMHLNRPSSSLVMEKPAENPSGKARLDS